MQLHQETQRSHKGTQRVLLLSILLVLTIASCVYSQAQPKKIKTLEVSDTISHAFVDRPGDLYLLTLGGQLHHFDKDGHLRHLYRKGPSLTSFDPRDGARLFAYYREKAQYDFLNPSFEVVQSFKIDSAFALDPWLVCVSGDHNVWILDGADLSLKKVDMRNGTTPVEVTLSLPAGKNKKDLLMLREYQNFVFLLDKKEGIMIFSSMGKLLRAIPAHNLRSFNFIGEELYYLTGDKLKFMDLFTTEAREMKLPTSGDAALLTDERLFVIRKNAVDIYGL